MFFQILSGDVKTVGTKSNYKNDEGKKINQHQAQPNILFSVQHALSTQIKTSTLSEKSSLSVRSSTFKVKEAR